MVLIANQIALKDAGAGREDPGTDGLAGIDHVLIREHIGGDGLRVTRGGDAVREVRQIRPRLRFVNRATFGPQVGMRINEAGNYGGAGEVHFGGASRHGHAARGAHGGDAIVRDHEIATRNDFVTLHGDHARIAQHHGSARDVAGALHHDALLGRLVRARAQAVGHGGVAARGRDGGGARRRRVEIVHHMRVADGPVHATAGARPRRELATDVGEPLHRHGGGVGVSHAHRRLRAARRHDHRVEILIDLRQRQLAGRRHERERGRRARRVGLLAVALQHQFGRVHVMIVNVAAAGRTGHPQMALFVTAIPTNGDEAVGARRQVDARRVFREVRHAAPRRARNHRGLTATHSGGRGGIPHKVRGRGHAGLIATPLRRSLREDNACSVWRPHRLP